ncbi:hypothetical protein ACLB5K_004302 [Enterobacter hormaechei]|uniref:Uncharacterized protein n=1 Tax=Enterobacter hormaechei TaxID=158836 RepID=A0AAX3Z889_9ENTR|nr:MULTISPECIES: hypothetical protein [Enterobacter cloacae complex]UAS96570.1 hypothetical protein K9O84_10720 [Enterobacter cloacae complex sp.]EGK60231.1 hypothetical protein HMPREF9086_2337 [Enterobacter hormaechei ATCC 49162]EJB6973951.1 hypothetical protein [Enterobacter hormaechei]EKT5041315.1 hypothetical protein [Enterobacter hormaechei]EKV4060128.1 hypothetical protein [Enterobacter hormaechei]
MHIFTPEKESCAKTSVTARTQKKVTPVSGEQKECQVAEAGFLKGMTQGTAGNDSEWYSAAL